MMSHNTDQLLSAALTAALTAGIPALVRQFEAWSREEASTPQELGARHARVMDFMDYVARVTKPPEEVA